MLKALGSTESKIQPGESGVRVGGSNGARCDGSESKIDDSKVDDDEVRDNEVRKKVQKLSKSKNLSKSKKIVGLDFLTPRAKLTFTKLRQAFVKAPIFHYFDLERRIQIEIEALGYAIGGVLSQLSLDDLD